MATTVVCSAVVCLIVERESALGATLLSARHFIFLARGAWQAYANRGMGLLAVDANADSRRNEEVRSEPDPFVSTGNVCGFVPPDNRPTAEGRQYFIY